MDGILIWLVAVRWLIPNLVVIVRINSLFGSLQVVLTLEGVLFSGNGQIVLNIKGRNDGLNLLLRLSQVISDADTLFKRVALLLAFIDAVCIILC